MARKTKKALTKKSKINSWLYWSPRILTILFIGFISMFALDIFGNGYTFWETIIGLFMHLIPSFVLIIFLIIAWKWEWVGTLGFFLFAAGYIIIIVINSMNSFEWYYLSWSLIIAGPAIIIGVLWWICWAKKKKF